MFLSEYRDFKRCIICRSCINLSHYCGEFEETLLINTLYMAVMFPIEKRSEYHIPMAKEVAKYLEGNGNVDLHGNQFSSDDIIRWLRNALAHYNIRVEYARNKISSIRLWAINRESKTICKQPPCKEPKCIPPQYKEDHGEICTFTFTMAELREFTYFVVGRALNRLPDDICLNCNYNHLFKNVPSFKMNAVL